MDSDMAATRFKMPGFGLPLNFLPDRDSKKGLPGGGELFKNALNTVHLKHGTTQSVLRPSTVIMTTILTV
jgi:hypothetical protein